MDLYLNIILKKNRLIILFVRLNLMKLVKFLIVIVINVQFVNKDLIKILMEFVKNWILLNVI